MEFWKRLFEKGIATIEILRSIVITPENQNGELTILEFEEITGIKF